MRSRAKTTWPSKLTTRPKKEHPGPGEHCAISFGAPFRGGLRREEPGSHRVPQTATHKDGARGAAADAP